MRHIRLDDGDVSEDGHPCEAALEFRRAAVRYGVTEEVPADALDLAVSFAWIGKAVSRTAEADAWILAGADPNTWYMVRAMAVDAEVRRNAVAAAKKAAPAAGRECELKALRATVAFREACSRVGETVGTGTSASQVERLAQLEGIAGRLPGPTIAVPFTSGVDNLVILDRFRKPRQAV